MLFRSATGQQLSLEIVRPHRVGVGKDVVLATLAQGYMIFQDDGLVDIKATADKIKSVSLAIAICNS